MKITKFLLSLYLLISALWRVEAQPGYENSFSEPLSEVLGRMEQSFDVKIECRRFLPDTVVLKYAQFRLRPYSCEESLDNICRALDLKFSKRGEGRYRVEPYEYYRRDVQQGEQLLGWLSAKYSSREQWEQRRKELLSEVCRMLDIDSMLDSLPEDSRVVLGEVRCFDGYTTQNFVMHSVGGVQFGGTIYAPRTGKGRRPLIVSPSGHWQDGRYRPDQQYRMATFARMGAVAVDFDIVGWGHYAHTLDFGHNDPRSMRMQLLWAKQVTDWIVAQRSDIDVERMAATGGSGGATHSLLLALIDSRFSVLAPVVHLVSHFDGGCQCESSVPITSVCGGSCTPELLAAAMAPKAVLTVSDGGDWTHSYPALEMPYLKRIWGFYGAEESVENCHFPDEHHDYGVNKRRAVYEFFARKLSLDLSKVDEQRVTIQPIEDFRENLR